MDVAGFIASFRGTTVDDVVPYKWSDAEVLEYLNHALDEACERAKLLEDDTTAACCQINLAAGTSRYALHASIVEVKEVRFRGRPLQETSEEAEAGADGVWRTRQGQPARYILSQEGTIRLVPTPTADFVGEKLELTVYRRELTARALTGPAAGAPELPVRYHHRLLNWMFHRAYLKKDAETLDLGRAANYERLFTADFGERIDANVQRKQRDRRPPVVRMRW